MRIWIKAAVAVLVLGGLLVGADRIALNVAEGQAADRLAGRQGLSGKPSVTIEDFPFLTDLLSRKVDRVKLSADSVQLTGGGRTFQLSDFSARLTGVQVGDDDRSATVDSGAGSGRISYQQAHDLLGLDGRSSLGYGGPGRLKVTVEVLGQKVSTTVKLRTEGNKVLVDSVGDVPGVGSLPGVSTMVSSAIGSHSFALDGMPVGLDLSEVNPQADGLSLAFQGTKVQLVG
ncbi:hypothetical protein GCM10009665_18190 [Kitasatospora nipponensis]|uniref:DUF2993 family protein n=1 Tax=Kitasatospora nipponensis TaxID=258049 RepID=A0ABP4GLT7_9ACTN